MPEYFAGLGVPILDGRDFADTDTLETPPVAILSRRAGELLFQGEHPLGGRYGGASIPTCRRRGPVDYTCMRAQAFADIVMPALE